MRLSTRLSESRDATRAIKLSWLTRSKSHDAVVAEALDQPIEPVARRSDFIAESQSAEDKRAQREDERWRHDENPHLKKFAHGDVLALAAERYEPENCCKRARHR